MGQVVCTSEWSYIILLIIEARVCFGNIIRIINLECAAYTQIWQKKLWQFLPHRKKRTSLSSGGRLLPSSCRNLLKPQSFLRTKGYLVNDTHDLTRRIQISWGLLQTWLSSACKREGLLWVTAVSGRGTMSREAGCRKYCLRGAFNTSEENRISLPRFRSPYPLAAT